MYTSKSFVWKEPDGELIDQVVEGCHAVQMPSGLVRRYGELWPEVYEAFATD